MVAELHATVDDGAAEIAPGWQLTVAPNPRAITAAAADARIDRAQLLMRFVGRRHRSRAARRW